MGNVTSNANVQSLSWLRQDQDEEHRLLRGLRRHQHSRQVEHHRTLQHCNSGLGYFNDHPTSYYVRSQILQHIITNKIYLLNIFFTVNIKNFKKYKKLTQCCPNISFCIITPPPLNKNIYF